MNNGMVRYMLYVPLHLIQPALSQKVEAKPVEVLRRECRQGGTAMFRREEACLARWMGLRLGLRQGRVSLLQTKSVSPALLGGIRAASQAVTGAHLLQVLHAVTSNPRNALPTGEVPQCLGLTTQVTTGYKSRSKGTCHALAAGTVSPWPRPQGCQQCQSSSAPRNERQNHNQLVNPQWLSGKVSRATAATKWPEGTSSLQPVRPLRNVPHAAHGQTGTT